MNSGRFKIPLIYIAVGISWIIFSDIAVHLISAHTSDHIARILGAGKGIFFILSTGFLLYLLLNKEREHKLQRTNAELNFEKQEITKNYYHLEDILNSIADSFFAFDRDWYITKANANFYTLTGITDDVTGKTIDEVFPGTKKNVFYPVAKKAMEEKVPGKIEDYSPIFQKWLRFSAFPTDDGIAVYLSDITAEKEKDIQLKLALERYDMASKATGDVIYDLDLVTKQLVFNRQVSELIKLPEEGLPDTLSWWRSLIHPEDVNGFSSAQEKRIADREKFWLAEYRIMISDNDYKYISDHGYLIFDEDDQPVRLIGAIKDIDLLKRSTEQLKRTGEILNKINNPVIISNADDIVIWVNPAFSAVTGYTESEVLGKDHASLLYNLKTNKVIAQQLLRAVKSREAFSADLLNYDKFSQEYWVSLNLYPIFDAQGKFECYISVQSDITEHKEKEAVIGLQNEKLKAVSWLNSHQIRKPVASILALAQLMKLSPDESEKAELLELLHRCAIELDDIILEINAEASGQVRVK